MYRKAVYTVEAAWIVSLCLLLIGFSVMTAFRMYEGSLSWLDTIRPEDWDAAETFRRFAAGKELLDGIAR